ncbi:MAG: electron transport complex subunit E [Christensenellaceae bacterium]|nr:electron transport complex subunit E [Christensenellaceae bacterium]
MQTLLNGIINENPTFRLMLGMCPTLAITTAASQGIGMGLATTFVLAGSNVVISLIRKIVDEKIRIPAFVVVIASFVTIVQMLIKAFLPALDKSLGIYIPLIVVNCIIFARAESYAFYNPPLLSLFDGIGMGLGFTVSITFLASVREIIGKGTFFGIQILPDALPPMGIIAQPPGGFLMLGLLAFLVNKLFSIYDRKQKEKEANA